MNKTTNEQAAKYIVWPLNLEPQLMFKPHGFQNLRTLWMVVNSRVFIPKFLHKISVVVMTYNLPGAINRWKKIKITLVYLMQVALSFIWSPSYTHIPSVRYMVHMVPGS